MNTDVLTNAIAATDLPELVAHYYPDAQIRGNGNKRRSSAPWRDGTSGSVALTLKSDGVWIFVDYASGATGNAYHFLTKIVGLEAGEAARVLINDAGLGGEISDERQAEIDRQRQNARERAAVEAAKEAAAKEAGRAKARSIFEQAGPVASSHAYLQKKAIGASEIPGARQSLDKLLIPITDLATGDFLGVQRITATAKKYSYGTDRDGRPGAFILGDFERAKRVAVVEGIATGVAVWRSGLFDVVAIAFDTNGLGPVAEAARARLPNADITFAADNDAYKPHVGNVGVRYASEAARAVGGLVAVPDFTGLDTSTEPTDFDDLHRLAGLEVVRQQLEAAGAPVAVAEHEPTPTELLARERGYQYRRVDARYMADGINLGDLPETGTIIPVGDQGTGKTEFIRRLIAADETVLVGSHLQALAGNLAPTLGTQCYNAITHEERHYAARLTSCIDSFPSLARHGQLPTYETVVLDESEQLLTRLTQDDIRNKPGVLEAVRYQATSAQRLVVADADMSALTLDFIDSLRPGDPVVVVESVYRPVEGRALEVIGDDGSLDKRLLARLSAGKRCYVASNSRKRIDRIAARIAKEQPDKRVLRVTSATVGNADVIAWLADPSSESLQYDVVLTSPSVSTGVSIQGDVFEFIAGYFLASVNTPQDCKQALRRVRNECEMVVWVQGSQRQYETDKDALRRRWVENPGDRRDPETVDSTGRLVPISAFYEQLWLSATSARHEKMNGFRGKLLAILRGAGYVVEKIDSAPDAKAQRAETKEAGDEAREVLQVAAIMEAPGDDEYEKLAQKDRLTYAERSAMWGYDERRRFRLPSNITEDEAREHVKLARDGALYREVAAVEVAVEDEVAAMDRQKRARVDDTGARRLRPDIRNVRIERELGRRALEAAGAPVTKEQFIANFESQPYHPTDERVQAFAAWCIDNAPRLANLMTVNPDDAPAKILGMTLRRLGLRTRSVGRGDKKRYYLTPESVQRVAEVVSDRCEPWQGYQPSETYKNSHTLSIKIERGVCEPKVCEPEAGENVLTRDEPPPVPSLARQWIRALENIVRLGGSLASAAAIDYRHRLGKLGIEVPAHLHPATAVG